MNLSLICFTRRGLQVCRTLMEHFRREGDHCLAWMPGRLLEEYPYEKEVQSLKESLSQWAGRQFEDGRAMVFIGAAGIAVRALAPWVRDKFRDPPVVAVDERASFVIPLLSGHVGGGNALALRIASFLGSTPVITTATDVNGLFAVDVYARERGFAITDREEARAVSAALLEGKQVGFFDEVFHDRTPEGCSNAFCSHNIWVTLKDGKAPDPSGGEQKGWLRLVPRALVLGLGCRRGTEPSVLRDQVLLALKEAGVAPEGVKAAATIDVKQDEEAVRLLAQEYGWELRFYSAEELSRVRGDFQESSFVEKTVGVGNVCERAACAEGGALLIRKRAGQGVTVAAAVETGSEVKSEAGTEAESEAGAEMEPEVESGAGTGPVSESDRGKGMQQGMVRQLRWGYTTGTCGAAASLAAAVMLLGGVRQEQAVLMTPKGIELELEIQDISSGEGWVRCGVKKDAGDDPDVTNGMVIFSRVSKSSGTGGSSSSGSRADAEKELKSGAYIYKNEDIVLVLRGGVGVGTVTKPGLSCEVGMPAINPVPREMIFSQVEAVCRRFAFKGQLEIEIQVPGGAETAERTFNPRLGILGGISILGTSGIVEPMSEKALLETIGLELRQKHLEGRERLIIAPGNYGTAFLKNCLGVDLDQAVKCSNFIGRTLDMAAEEGLKAVLLVGHGGKLIKTAAGIMNTHSSVADGRMEILGAYGAACGAEPELVDQLLKAVTVDQGLELLETRPGLREQVMERIMERIACHLGARAGEGLKIEVIVFTNERGILGMTPGAQALLDRIKTQEG